MSEVSPRKSSEIDYIMTNSNANANVKAHKAEYK